MTKQELEMCISEYGRDIYSFCVYITGSRQLADDLYQDTFLKVTQLSAKISADSNPKSYILSVALRIWKNHKRKYAVRQRIADVQCEWDEQALMNVPDSGAEPDECVIRQEEKLLVRAAVNRLPDKLRVVVLLFYMSELSVEDIARTVGVPQGTVLSRLHRARIRLKDELEGLINGKEA